MSNTARRHPAIIPSTLTPSEQGRIAAAKGYPADSCPYSENTEAAREWLQGWSTERRLQMRERV